MITPAILAVIDERRRQDEKWGDQSGHPKTLWLTILAEEVGEVAKAVLENDPGLRDELIQVAAVAVAAVEAIDKCQT